MSIEPHEFKLTNDIEDDLAKLTQMYVELKQLYDDLVSHKAENVTQGDEPHGMVYEEGTWTPELQFGGASTGIQYSSQLGRYVRMGNYVFVDMQIGLTSKGTAAGIAQIRGLPFTQAFGIHTHHLLTGSARVSYPSDAEQVVVRLNASSDTLLIYYVKPESGYGALNNLNFVDTSELQFGFTYRI